MTAASQPSAATLAPPLTGTGGSAPAARWLGLDALRGLSIGLMILVNNPGEWGAKYQYDVLRHAEWHGCTPTDLVFPTFLFCAGVAIVPALQKKLATGAPRAPLALAIGKRALWLVLLGLFVASFPLVTFEAGKDLFDRVWNVRFPGVLQRIGVCYAVAALLFLFTSARTQARVLLGCLFGHWALLTLAPVPGVGPQDLAGPATTLQGWIDRAVFGDHIWVKGKYDPEGLLSTLSAVATALFGVLCGRVLAAGGAPRDKAGELLRLGAWWLLAGAVWSWFLPVNKPLWTPSYAVWTAGIAASGLGLCVWLFEHRGYARFAHPLRVYGQNALLVFVGSAVVARTVGRLVTVTTDAGTVSLQKWFFANCLLGPIGDPKLASLAFGLVWISGWYVVLAALYRRGIVWRV